MLLYYMYIILYLYYYYNINIKYIPGCQGFPLTLGLDDF